MKFIFPIILLNLLFTGTTIYSQKEKSEFKAVIESETGDTGLIIIYGKISEVSCPFTISDVHINYGKKRYYINNKDTDPFRSDSQGNYIIEIRSYQQDLGLSFNYWGDDSHADFFVPIPKKWKGMRIKMDIGLKLLFYPGGLECF